MSKWSHGVCYKWAFPRSSAYSSDFRQHCSPHPNKTAFHISLKMKINTIHSKQWEIFKKALTSPHLKVFTGSRLDLLSQAANGQAFNWERKKRAPAGVEHFNQTIWTQNKNGEILPTTKREIRITFRVSRISVLFPEWKPNWPVA